jgi:hypothetical protein
LNAAAELEIRQVHDIPPRPPPQFSRERTSAKSVLVRALHPTVSGTVTLDIENATFRATVDGITIEGAALKDGFPSYPDHPVVEAHARETAIEVLMFQHQVFVCVFYKGNVIAALDRQLTPIDLDLAETIFADISPFENAEWWRHHHWELLNPDPETTCGEYLVAKLAEAERISTSLYI